MIIRCPSCETCYDIAEQSIGDEGRLVECVRCKHRWTANKEAPADAETETAADPFEQQVSDLPAESQFENSGPIEFDISDHQEVNASEIVDGTSLYGHKPVGARGSHAGVQTRKRIVVKRKARKNSSSMQVFLLLLAMGMLGSGVSMREQIVRSVPQMAALFDLVGLPVNLTKLEFQDLAVSQVVEQRADILIVKGRIANISDEVVGVPALRITLRSSDSLALYSWDKNLEFETLEPGTSAEFEAKLASPPPEAKDLTVRFVPRTKKTVELRQ